MLSKAQIKHITALRSKKYRTEHAQFIVEGKKSIEELLKSDFEIISLYYTADQSSIKQKAAFAEEISPINLAKLSAQKNPEGLLAIVKTPPSSNFILENQRYIALDKIRDPGNLGTIIRLADWFGINKIICSPDCVELYNPKVVQASMGSIFHTSTYEVDLVSLFQKATIPILATTLGGESVYKKKPLPFGVLVIGNEANGISPEVLAQCHQEVTIPNKGKAESLNAAMACGILCSHLFD